MKISDICLKQDQGMRGRAAPPHPGIYRVPPRPPGSLPQGALKYSITDWQTVKIFSGLTSQSQTQIKACVDTGVPSSRLEKAKK